ncbi:P-loop NTPase [Candidatus Woesearchaeota archaeon]|nr:P-loop NTPase [Candidatus Woesearchaeota archaeon]
MNYLDVFQNRRFGEAVEILSEEQTEAGLVKIVGDELKRRDWKVQAWAVGAPKGGIGKTQIAINLSHVLASMGLKVGYVDVDMYDPNGLGYVLEDLPDGVNGDSRVNRSLIDVVVGKRVSAKVDGKRTSKRQRKSLTEVGIESKSRSQLNYFLTNPPGEASREKGSRAERERALNKAHGTILDEIRKVDGYHVFVLDFPAGMPQYLDAFIGCDQRVYIVDFENFASFDGVMNISNILSTGKHDLSKGGNILLVNKIPQGNIEGFLNTRFVRALSGGVFDGHYGKTVHKENAEILYDQFIRSLEGLSFDSHFLVLNHEGIKSASNKGVPFLSNFDSGNEVFYREIRAVADYLIERSLK